MEEEVEREGNRNKEMKLASIELVEEAIGYGGAKREQVEYYERLVLKSV